MISRYVHESETVSNFPDDLARDITEAKEVLTQLRRKSLIEYCFNQNSREVVAAWNDVAKSFIKIGNYEKALHYAQRSFHAAETQFGSYSEETLAALMALGEIEEKVGQTEAAFKTFEKALSTVEKLHHNHPLIAVLNMKLYFLRKSQQSENESYLKTSFQSFQERYGEEKAYLLPALIALKNNNPIFVGQILNEIRRHPTESLLEISQQFWPKELIPTPKPLNTSCNPSFFFSIS